MNTLVKQDSEMVLPMGLIRLIEDRVWPRNERDALVQYENPLVSSDDLQRWAPEEDRFFLYPPPFVTVSDEIMDGDDMWLTTVGAQNHIDPSATLIIGDFGPGSESVVALDYQKDWTCPSVIRLVWEDARLRKVSWKNVSDSFDQFLYLCGLLSSQS